MYCSSCGSAFVQGSSYCNRCGAKAPGGKGRKSKKAARATPDGLVWAIVSVLLGGIGLTMGFATFLKKELGFTEDLILLFTVVIFSLVVSVSGAFLWLLVRGARDDIDEELVEKSVSRPTSEIGPAQAHLLNAPPASIVEGTTRNFEPAMRENYDEIRSLDTAGRSRTETSS
jgi:hypothetical protein